MERTFDELNQKIKSGKVKVLTALEAKSFIKEKGIKTFFNEVDIVTCASFEMHTNAVAYFSFGQTDPMIYFSSCTVNNVPAYSTGPTDFVLSCVAHSTEDQMYGGAHVLSELVSGKDINLKAEGRHLEVFPNRNFETWFNLKDINCLKLFLNQSVSQNNIVAVNSGDKDINSHMGTLIAHMENSTFNSSSFLNPLINDPFSKTIGIGTKVWIAGSQGIIVGEGSNHNPSQKRNEYGIPVGSAITLSAVADVKNMNPKWIRGGYLRSFGPVLYIGVGLPIPVLNEEIAESLSITDDKISTTIVDFSIPRRTKPTFGQCSYSELRTTTVLINNKPTLSAPLSSMAFAVEISEGLKKEIQNSNFYLSKPVKNINLNSEFKKLDSRLGEVV